MQTQKRRITTVHQKHTWFLPELYGRSIAVLRSKLCFKICRISLSETILCDVTRPKSSILILLLFVKTHRFSLSGSCMTTLTDVKRSLKFPSEQFICRSISVCTRDQSFFLCTSKILYIFRSKIS